MVRIFFSKTDNRGARLMVDISSDPWFNVEFIEALGIDVLVNMVRITIEPQRSWAERTAGMLKWTGDPDVLRRIAEDDEFSLLESP